MGNEKYLKIIVKGKVQGVFFRKYAKITANLLGIKGFVRNDADNSVYIEACGENKAIDEFIKWCHKGPVHAVVEKVNVSEIAPKKFTSFDIIFL